MSVPITVVTIAELSNIVGRKPQTLRKYTNLGILPEANLKIAGPPKIAPDGIRVYTLELANELKECFMRIQVGVAVDSEVKQKIRQAFMNERKRLNLDNPLKK